MKLKDHPYFVILSGCGEPVSDERLSHIRQLKEENPDASRRELAMLAFDSEYAVELALK
jgi:hypothetical protein